MCWSDRSTQARQAPARSEAGRPPDGAADEVRAGNQSGHREVARHRNPAEPARPRRRGDRMRRREFITLLGGAAAAWPIVAPGQPSDRIRRVVVAMIMTENDPQSSLNVRAVRHGLTESGWAEGRDLKLDFLFGINNADRIDASVAALLTQPPDVFLVHGTAITASLHRRTRAVPIVFA